MTSEAAFECADLPDPDAVLTFGGRPTSSAGVIALGRDWYQRIATAPDSLAGHPEVIHAANLRDRSEVLFYEDVNYAASGAFELITGDRDMFCEAWNSFREAGAPGSDVVDMGGGFRLRRRRGDGPSASPSGRPVP